MSGATVRELARVTDPILRRVAGMVRRMTVAVTTSPIWRLTGVRLGTQSETVDAEAFTGIGFYARPPTTGGKPEVILVNVGDARAPVVIAARDEKTCATVRDGIGGLAAGEAMVFAPNGGAVVHLKADGTVEIKTPTGTAVELATKADVDAIMTYLAAHTHTGVTTGAGISGTVNAAPSPPAMSGTSVLKGE